MIGRISAPYGGGVKVASPKTRWIIANHESTILIKQHKEKEIEKKLE